MLATHALSKSEIAARVWTRYALQNAKAAVADVDGGVDVDAAVVASVETTVTISRETADGVPEVAEGAGFVHFTPLVAIDY